MLAGGVDMSGCLVSAVLGVDTRALPDHVRFAGPLAPATMTGRLPVIEAIRAYSGVLGLNAIDDRLYGEGLDGAVFSASAGREPGQFLMVGARDARGRVTSIDLFGQSWTGMSALHRRIAADYPEHAQGGGVPTGCIADAPDEGWRAPVPFPPLAADPELRMPVLARSVTGEGQVAAVLGAAASVLGGPRYRPVLGVAGENAIVVRCDATVRGSSLQLAIVLSLNDRDLLRAATIFSRPWPVTTYFRSELRAALADTLGPEYWECDQPTLPEAITAAAADVTAAARPGSP